MRIQKRLRRKGDFPLLYKGLHWSTPVKGAVLALHYHFLISHPCHKVTQKSNAHL